ncbi:uncharacterized protein LOC116177436 [Photinus pyralis]|uniref:uncharacterized protein LOC116177436 n=1 Tax=Photinus pyralis TaxID=7054 RepID=UPI0012673E62|nr:uncharacterized protein LOC116177436 [Photinus pyralis]
MKSLVAVVVLALALHSVASQSEYLQEVINSYLKYIPKVEEACRALTGVDPVEADRLLNPGVLSVDEPFKNYLTCLFRGLDLLNDDGSINFGKFTVFMAKENPGLAEFIIKACGSSEVGEDVNERLWNFTNCVFQVL